MTLVLDASVVLAWALPDERSPVATVALERTADEDAVVPALWWFEVRNALIASERRRRLDQGATATFLQRLARLPVQIDRSPDEAALLALARRHRLTVYDAAYLELAVRVGATLATGDTALAEAARREAVTLLAAG